MQIYHDKCFVNPIEKIIAFDEEDIKSAFARIEICKTDGKYLLGYVRYSAGDAFLDYPVKSRFPLVYFEVYESYAKYVPYNPKKYVSIFSEPEISFAQYESDLNKIKNHILLGNTYEVNYTYPYKIYTNADNLELYNYLLMKQTTDYNAMISNRWEEILSFSPELFFKLKGNKIITKPMKGTMERGVTPEKDCQNKEFLQNDTKNQAENVMIVDLLRNDLSKIAKTGTVKVDKLFEIEEHPTLFQMTSEISAELRDGTTLYDIFRAIFPCGSITGAPKISTMNIIEELEQYPRGVYCGAIGFISPDECTFSVPIRILQRQNQRKYYRYHTGGAIVWDSDINDEWNETLTKKKFLETSIHYDLLETVLIEGGKVKLFEYHKQRIEESARKLGFKFLLENFVFDTTNDCAARFLLSYNGKICIEYIKPADIKSNKIKISKDKMHSSNPFLYHKTTFRPWYNYVLKDYFDVIFMNEKDEITEGTRSNIVVQLNGILFTPPVKCGLLNGTYRQYMIEKGLLQEKILHYQDLINSEKIYCINSVRGMVEVCL